MYVIPNYQYYLKNIYLYNYYRKLNNFRIYLKKTRSYHWQVKCCRDFFSSPVVAKQEVVNFKFIGFIMPK